jgi:hypothetical protein
MVTRSQAARAFLWARSRRYFLRVQRTKVGVDARQEHGQRGAVERAVVLLHPRTTGLIISASSARLSSVRRCSCHLRTVRLSRFKASLLVAGRNAANTFPPRTPGCAGPEPGGAFGGPPAPVGGLGRGAGAADSGPHPHCHHRPRRPGSGRVVLVVVEVGEQGGQVGVAKRPDRHAWLLVVARWPSLVGVGLGGMMPWHGWPPWRC